MAGEQRNKQTGTCTKAHENTREDELLKCYCNVQMNKTAATCLVIFFSSLDVRWNKGDLECDGKTVYFKYHRLFATFLLALYAAADSQWHHGKCDGKSEKKNNSLVRPHALHHENITASKQRRHSIKKEFARRKG